MTQKALLQSAGDGTAVPQGYVGEVQVFSGRINMSTSYQTNASGTLSAGTWLVNAFSGAATTAFSDTSLSFTLKTSSESDAGSPPVGGQNGFFISSHPANSPGCSFAGVRTFTLNGNTTIQLRTKGNAGNGAFFDGTIIAVRIA